MPINCSAINCMQRGVKGSSITFHRFPLKNKEILAKWIKAIRRYKWTPTIFSRICSDHFTSDSYQIRPGAFSKRLREKAVPSIFNFPQVGKKISELHNLKKKSPPLVLRESAPVIKDSTSPVVRESRRIRKFPPLTVRKTLPPSSDLNSANEDVAEVQNNTVRARLKLAIAEQQKDYKIKTLKQRVCTLQRQVEDLRRGLRRFFTPDQVHRLTDPKRTVWSMATIKDCLILRFALGDKGYEYLHNKGYPIPSPPLLLRQMKYVDMKKLKYESLEEDPDICMESSSTNSVQTNYEATNAMPDINETTNLVSNIIPQRYNKSMASFDGNTVQDKGATFSSDLEPGEVKCQIVNVRSLNDKNEFLDPSDTNNVLTSDETGIETDTNHITTSDGTVNQADANYVTNCDETVIQADSNHVTNSNETIIQADTNHVQNSVETDNLSDIEIRPDHDKNVMSNKTHRQNSVETMILPDTEDGVKCVSSFVTGVPNEDEANPMEWEICIEQDLSPSETDNAGKKESAWRIALAALQLSVNDSGSLKATHNTSKRSM